jgi:protein phosphatase
VLRALDGRAREPAAVTRFAAREGDRLLLCSDGLSDVVAGDAIAATLADGPADACAERLVELALAAGARDNVSVVVADVVARRPRSSAWTWR